MPKRTVSIVDYGSGNLLSVSRAVIYCGAVAKIVKQPSEIAASDVVLIPGVGAFPSAMKNLSEKGFVNKIRSMAAEGAKIIGICAGMQLLFMSSEEFGHCDGFGFISGKVVKLPKYDIQGQLLKIPHIGWSEIRKARDQSTDVWAVAKDKFGSFVYLAHSFHVIPDDINVVRAFFDFGGHNIVAAVQHENIFGLQFHPEKSGEHGLQIFDQCLNEMRP